jgi:putative Mg2+ transporter-C (MgtC) family protein
MPTDPAFQLDLTFRLLASAALGAGLGLEREAHGHPAGMRTHLRVSLGSAIFTILSVYAFAGTGSSADPSRIAAQVVTGIGFLGAGAIVKYGPNIRGLTTAGSLWVVAAIGISCGAGAYYVAVAGTLIAVAALWPLHIVVQRLETARTRTLRIRLRLKKLDSFAGVSQILLNHHIAVTALQSEKSKTGHMMDVELRLPNAGTGHAFLAEVDALPGVDVETVMEAEEA